MESDKIVPEDTKFYVYTCDAENDILRVETGTFKIEFKCYNYDFDIELISDKVKELDNVVGSIIDILKGSD